jgi:tellurite resistance protein
MLVSAEAPAVELEREPGRFSPLIERSDFQIAWRGFKREQVARHLKEVAGLIDERQEPPELRLTNELLQMVNRLQEAVASSAAEIRTVHERASAEAKQALGAAEEEASRIRSEAEIAAQRTRANADRYVELRWRELEEAKERLARSTEEASWFFDAAGYDFGQMRECLDMVDESPSSAEELERRADNAWHDLGDRSHAFGDKLRSGARSGGRAAGEGGFGVRAVTPQVG